MGIQFEVHDDLENPINGKCLIQRHLNFEVRYKVLDDIVTHKFLWFHEQQVPPSVSKCCHGKCVLALCRLAEANGTTTPEDLYDPSKDNCDPLIGKLVKISAMDHVTFHDPDGDEQDLDLNWRRLRNLAQPVVDEQLARLAMAGKWKKQPIRLTLGALAIDKSA